MIDKTYRLVELIRHFSVIPRILRNNQVSKHYSTIDLLGLYQNVITSLYFCAGRLMNHEKCT